jgi:heat-inducible transcriptional repressor
MDIAQLNERSKEIFKLIVETYLETGDPVGSRTISKVGGVDLSAATIRNVMADLEQTGLLISPHTSAGRIPTDTGLRLFVDGMMQVGNLTRSERESIQGTCSATGRVFEDVLSEATKALSGLSKCTSLVMVPKQNQIVQHIEFVSIAPDKAIVILVGQNGTVENRVISLPPGLPPSVLVQAGNYLNARLAGKNLDDVKDHISVELHARQAELDNLTAKVVEEGLAIWSGNGADVPASLIVSGQANLLENLEAAEDLDRIRGLFEELEQKKELIRLLDLAKDGRGVRMFIGAENNLFSLSGSSLVVSPYMNGANKVVGVIGVIGPTRLNYARIIPMVDYTAQVVGRLL